MDSAINTGESARKDRPRDRILRRKVVGRFEAPAETPPEGAKHLRGKQLPGAPCAVEPTNDPIGELEGGLAHMMAELADSRVHEITEPIAAIELSAEACLRWIDRDPPALEDVRRVLLRIINDAKRAASILERNRSLDSDQRHE
jgi:hypothetical protein